MAKINKGLTHDIFGCGICSIQMNSIHDYVSHMMKEEQCSVIMEESPIIKDLVLPRFIYDKKIKRKKLNEEQFDVEEKFDEIETGCGIRWKCRFCLVTFSRKVSIENHFRLQHHGQLQKSTDVKLKKFKAEQNSIKFDYKDLTEVIDIKPLTNMNQLEIPFTQPNCYLCSQIFKTMKSLQSHLDIVHNERRPFQCKFNDCKYAFKTKGSLMRHQRRHTNMNPYICNLCNKGFRESGALLRHTRSRVCQKGSIECKSDVKPRLKEEATTVCHLNNEITNDNEIMSKFTIEDRKPFNQNKKNIYSSVIRTSFTCPVCVSQYEEYSELQDHIKIHTATVGRECVQCHKRFNTNQSLVRHLQTHSTVRQYECVMCRKTFKLKSHAESHLLSHSDSKEHSCSECEKSFKTVSSRNIHMKTHNGSKPFKCGVCTKSFGVKSSLERHNRIHTGEKPFKCLYCNYMFKEHGTLNRHLRNKESCASLHKLDLKNDEAIESEQSLEKFSDSELEEFLSEQQDLNIYSEYSQMSFESDNEFFGLPPIKK